MSWGEIFLGVIAVSALVTMCLQIGAVVAIAKVATQTRRALETVHQDVRPLVAHVTSIAADASRTSNGVAAQVEKVDRLVTDLTRRIDDTSLVVQQALITPAREGIAIMAALKAGIAALRHAERRRSQARHAEEEDALFIG